MVSARTLLQIWSLPVQTAKSRSDSSDMTSTPRSGDFSLSYQLRPLPRRLESSLTDLPQILLYAYQDPRIRGPETPG